MNKILIPILFALFSALTCPAQINFSVPRGATVRNFTFTADGALKYAGREFSPAVKFGEEKEKLQISLLPDKGLAGALAVDGAENSFVFLDTKKGVSTDFAEISAPQKMFWSPSRRFLLVYGEYEGAWFYSIDVAARRVRQNANWFPGYDLWVLQNAPRWIGKSDLLTFKVVVGCDPTADPSNPCEDKPAYYEVRIDAATMRLRNKKRVRHLN